MAEITTLGPVIKTTYEAEPDTNAFTDSEKAKLADLPATIDAAAVGLGNVNNTSDVNKPVSTAQQQALDLKVDIADLNPAAVGLGNVDNTSDADKPVSIATQDALDLKAGLSDLTAAAVGLGDVDNTSDADKPVSTAQQTALNLKVSSNTTGIAGADAISNMVSLTQAEYTALTPSATTFYVITDA